MSYYDVQNIKEIQEMRIAIVTLPLHTNYGGILQAYALRKVLMDRGHEVDVLDKYNKLVMTPAWKMPQSSPRT